MKTTAAYLLRSLALRSLAGDSSPEKFVTATSRPLLLMVGVMTLFATTALTGCNDDGEAFGGQLSDQTTNGQPDNPIREPDDPSDNPPDNGPGLTPIQEGASAPNLGQGGAQDIGELRQILESGRIPDPAVLDEVGFFNVHRLTFPAPDCGDDVCLHGLLGMMGNMISGSKCTVVMLGMNTPLDPDALERPPVDLVVALDTSAAMTEHIDLVALGLTRMLDHLEATDSLSLVAFDSQPRLLVNAEPGGGAVTANWFSMVRTEGPSDVYSGLRAAYEQAERLAAEGRQARVLLVLAGSATHGLTNTERIAEMSAGFTSGGVGLTAIGIGAADGTLLRRLTETGIGNSFFVEDADAIDEVFTEEIDTFIVPIATDVRITIQAGGDYWLGRIHGSHHTALSDEFTGSIEIPSLFIAQRTTATDDDIEDPPQGRRGGGGAILIELIPDALQVDPFDVGSLEIQYRIPGTTEWREQRVDIVSSVEPVNVTASGRFDTPSVEKGFVMLNIYVGFEMAAERAAGADYLGALRILRALRGNVVIWLEENPDIDIADDLVLVELFIENVDRAWDAWVLENPEIEEALLELEENDQPQGETRLPIPEPWPSD